MQLCSVEWSIARKPSLHDILRATGSVLPVLAIRAIRHCWKNLHTLKQSGAVLHGDTLPCFMEQSCIVWTDLKLWADRNENRAPLFLLFLKLSTVSRLLEGKYSCNQPCMHKLTQKDEATFTYIENAWIVNDKKESFHFPLSFYEQRFHFSCKENVRHKDFLFSYYSLSPCCLPLYLPFALTHSME